MKEKSSDMLHKYFSKSFLVPSLPHGLLSGRMCLGWGRGPGLCFLDAASSAIATIILHHKRQVHNTLERRRSQSLCCPLLLKTLKALFLPKS